MNKDALDIAKYIINYINDSNQSITHLQLQEVLYQLQLKTIKKHKQLFFKDSIEAWKTGPVIHQVYLYYSKYSYEQKIIEYRKSRVMLTKQEEKLIKNIIKDVLNYSDEDILSKRHSNIYWKKAIEKGIKNEITFG